MILSLPPPPSTTVMHGFRKIGKLVDNDREVAAEVAAITAKMGLA